MEDNRTLRNIYLLFSFKFILEFKEDISLNISRNCFDKTRLFAIDCYNELMKLTHDDVVNDVVSVSNYADLNALGIKEQCNAEVNLHEKLNEFILLLNDKCGHNSGEKFRTWLIENIKWFNYSGLNLSVKFRSIMTLGKNDWGNKATKKKSNRLPKHIIKRLSEFADIELLPLWNNTWSKIERIRLNNTDSWDAEHLIYYQSNREYENEPISSAPTPVLWPYGFIANVVLYSNFEGKLKNFITGLSEVDKKSIEQWFLDENDGNDEVKPSI